MYHLTPAFLFGVKDLFESEFNDLTEKFCYISLSNFGRYIRENSLREGRLHEIKEVTVYRYLYIKLISNN